MNRATHAAERLGGDADYWQTGFGPTNVALHVISTHLDLGDVDFVVRVGPEVRTDHLAVERRVSHMIDVARALSLVARDDESTGLLLEADAIAPFLVRHNPSVRETVKSLHRRSAAAGHGSSAPLGALAERCRAL